MNISATRIRTFLAVATALAGGMNVLSALFPDFRWRYLMLRDMVSVSVINDSQVATVLLGLWLILLADRLAKRQRRAMWLTFAALLISAFLHVTKGLDYEEALVCLAIASLLFARRTDYVVPSRPIDTRNALTLIGSLVALFFTYDLLGFRILARWITPAPTFMGAISEPIRIIADGPAYSYHGYQAHWFGVSLMLLGTTALIVSAVLLLRPFIPIHLSHGSDRERAKAIIRRCGSDTLSYFALRNDRSYYFAPDDAAFLSYRIWRNVALVGGDPVGPRGAISPLTRGFLEFCESNGLLPCFLGTSGRNLALYRALRLRVLKIGEESVIRLNSFDVSNLKRKVRRAERHSTSAGIEAAIYPADAVPDSFREQAVELSRMWVERKGGCERGFSMTLGRFPDQTDHDLQVLIAHQDDRVLGFLTFVPVFGGNGWSLDMMRRNIETPNGLTEFMVMQAARHFQAEGYDFISLNFASLSSTEAAVQEPRLVTSLRKFLFENLSSVYQLKSLYQFNAKFDPEWSPRYLVYGDLIRAPKVVMAVVQAEDPIRLSTVASVFRRGHASEPSGAADA